MSSPTTPAHGARQDFIRDIVIADNASGKHGGRVATRFPPEPNGYLHIGHAKSICLNFGIAGDFSGTCNLRFDDTNPITEDVEYVDSIQEDVRWLGFSWEGRLYYASDYFQQLYDCAETLIKDGHAYVDDLNPDQIRRARHHRTGDRWCIYPMYDYAHPISDALERITHSICTLEFEAHRPLYDWLIQNLPLPGRPQQIEFARLNLNYTVLSKRKLLQLVNEKRVSGWDDPRMPTISGMRRRGYTPEAIRRFCEDIGVAKRENTVDVGLLEFFVREDLNA